MKIQDVINDLNKAIANRTNEISLLNKKKENLQLLQNKYPNCLIQRHDVISMPNIWDKITCMRAQTNYNWHSISISVKFYTGKSVPERRIYAEPYNVHIAEISNLNGPLYNNIKTKEIKILDYKSIIPEDHKKRKSFIRRLKKYILNYISYNPGIKIAKDSFEKEEFEKLLLLK